mmetsp:Transcript_24254/g.21359  ORF Transcript_24254/g.21359 Transcript_24254/m.21359 type:complete len:229 (-) Transcript_24254:598-1284(-)
MQDIVASFQEAVKSDEQSISGELPAAIGLSLVLEVDVLELVADINDSLELVAGILLFVITDHLRDDSSVDEANSLGDDGVTDFSDEDDKSWGSVVVLGVLPDQEDDVHDGEEDFVEGSKISAFGDEILEGVLQSLQKFIVIIGFHSVALDFLVELVEGDGVGGLVLFQEFEDLLYSIRLELLIDGIQILTLLSPEFNFGEGVGVVSSLESLFGFKLEDVLDLLCPSND